MKGPLDGPLDKPLDKDFSDYAAKNKRVFGAPRAIAFGLAALAAASVGIYAAVSSSTRTFEQAAKKHNLSIGETADYLSKRIGLEDDLAIYSDELESCAYALMGALPDSTQSNVMIDLLMTHGDSMRKHVVYSGANTLPEHDRQELADKVVGSLSYSNQRDFMMDRISMLNKNDAARLFAYSGREVGKNLWSGFKGLLKTKEEDSDSDRIEAP